MFTNKQISTKPGMVVKEYIKSKGITQTEFAARMGTNVKRLGDVISGYARINANMAMKLASAANDPLRNAQYWMGIQSEYDLQQAVNKMEEASA